MKRLYRISLLCLGFTVSAVATAATAQQTSIWPERPGDIVISRNVPGQNAIAVGEPGRPTVANPGAMVLRTTALPLDSDMFARPLSDLEAQTVRGARSPRVDHYLNGHSSFLKNDVDAAIGTAGTVVGRDGVSSLGATISGNIGGATRQMQGALASALRQGGL